MPVTATGARALVMDGIVAMISNCAAFRTWVGAASAAAALADIHVEGFLSGGDLSGLRPFAMVGVGSYRAEAVAGGASVAYADSYEWHVIFEGNVTAGHSEKDAFYSWSNTIDAIRNQMKALANQDRGDGSGLCYPFMASIEQAGGPARSNVREGDCDGDFIQEAFDLNLGWPGGGG